MPSRTITIGATDPAFRFSGNRATTPRAGKTPRCGPTWARIEHDRCEWSLVIFRAGPFGERPGQTLLFNSVERASGTFTRDVISQIPPI